MRKKKKLTKHRLAEEIVRKCGGFKKDALVILDVIIAAMADHFAEGGEHAELRGLGTFRKITRKAYKGTDPRNGTPLDIPEVNHIAFKTSRELAARMK